MGQHRSSRLRRRCAPQPRIAVARAERDHVPALECDEGRPPRRRRSRREEVALRIEQHMKARGLWPARPGRPVSSHRRGGANAVVVLIPKQRTDHPGIKVRRGLDRSCLSACQRGAFVLHVGLDLSRKRIDVS